MDEQLKLYNQLVKDKLYSKSYEDFKVQFSTPEKQKVLHEKLVNDKLYSRDLTTFQLKFFPVEKKKEEQPESAPQQSISLPAMQVTSPNPVQLPYPKEKQKVPYTEPVVKEPVKTQPTQQVEKIELSPIHPEKVSMPITGPKSRIEPISKPEPTWESERDRLEAVRTTKKGGFNSEQTDIDRQLFEAYYKLRKPSDTVQEMNLDDAVRYIQDIQKYGPPRNVKPDLFLKEDCPKGICVGPDAYPPRYPEYARKAVEENLTKMPEIEIKEEYGKWVIDPEDENQFKTIEFDSEADAKNYKNAIRSVVERNSNRWVNKVNPDGIEDDQYDYFKKELARIGRSASFGDLLNTETGNEFINIDFEFIDNDVYLKTPDGNKTKINTRMNPASFASILSKLSYLREVEKAKEDKENVQKAIKLLSKTTRGF